MERLIGALVRALPVPVVSIGLMTIAGASFSAMHVTIRIVSADIHPFEIAFFRNFFGFLVMVPWLVTVGRLALRTERLGLHSLRSVLNAASMMSWFTALSLLPVADASALALAGPLFVAIGAAMFLGERVMRQRWGAIALGAAGALVIVRPGFETVSAGAGLVLLSSVLVSSSKLMAKRLSETEATATIVAWLTLLMIPITLVPALFVWTTPTAEQFGLLALIGAFGTTGHLLFVRAYKLADVSLVEPAIFMRFVWAAVFGLLILAEFPDQWTWVGAGIIVVATTLLARQQTVVALPPGTPVERHG